MPSDIPELNRGAYGSKELVRAYAASSELQTAEAVILSRHLKISPEDTILDIGVGGGRTTPYLLAKSRRYIGADFCPELVAAARNRYPGIDFRQDDARSLQTIPNGSIDLLWFSFNGIDTLDHAGRLQALCQFRRVLKASGQLVFSSHNQASASPRPWSFRHLRGLPPPHRHPRAFARAVFSFGRGIYNHHSRRQFEVRTDQYEIRNDPAFAYGLLNYYITPERQLQQLRQAGFSSQVRIVALDGQELGPAGWKVSQDPWLHYLVRRGAE